MAYNTSFPMVPQNGIPFHLAEMILLGESGGEKKSRLSAEQCPAAVQRHRMRETLEEGCFPAPGAQRQANGATLVPAAEGTKQGRARESSERGRSGPRPPLCPGSREGIESLVLHPVPLAYQPKMC